MAMTNFTVNAGQGSDGILFCSKESAEGRKSQLVVAAAVNIVLSITAFLGNALILAALHKESSLYPPFKLLLRILATTDLAVGIIVQPLHVVYFISLLTAHWNFCRTTFIMYFITSYILGGISVLTMTAISVDRLLPLLLGLRYRQVVTLKRTYVIVIVFWFVSISCSTMYLWNLLITLWSGSIDLSLCLGTSVFSYAKIFFNLRQYQIQEQGQQNQNVLLNRARYKKIVNSALWVQIALVVCYLPQVIMQIIVGLRRELPSSDIIALSFTATLVLLNSSLNPIIYCWKIKEVRQAVKDIVKGLFCSSS